MCPILASIPQGASPTLFNLYSIDQPSRPEIHNAYYADKKVIYSTSDVASNNCQNYINVTTVTRCQNLHISLHKTFALHRGHQFTYTINPYLKLRGLTFHK